jgi:putative FmdB family regulatory protein
MGMNILAIPMAVLCPMLRISTELTNMPLYTYHCDSCGQTSIEYQRMADNPLVICTFCGRETLKKVPSLFGTGGLKDYDKPIEMFSVGCNSKEQVREIQEKCPGVEISDDENDPMFGVPIAANRKQKLSVLKAVGYVERN